MYLRRSVEWFAFKPAARSLTNDASRQTCIVTFSNTDYRHFLVISKLHCLITEVHAYVNDFSGVVRLIHELEQLGHATYWPQVLSIMPLHSTHAVSLLICA